MKAALQAKAAAGKIRYFINHNGRELFVDRIQSQEEIHRLIEEVFGEREKIKLEEFSEIVEKITSEMFLAVTSATI